MIEHRYADDCTGTRHRVICAGLAVAVHATALVLLLISAPIVPPSRADVITAFSLPGPATPAVPHPGFAAARSKPAAHAAAASAPRALFARAPSPVAAAPVAGPMVLADILKLAGMPADIAPVSAPTGPIGGACDLTNPVQTVLQADPDVRAQLPTIPADQRTAANAIVVWNAGWLHADDAAAKSAYAAIRTAVAGAVLAAPDACRAQVQSGPRLVFLTDSHNRTTVLALGSGQWTWQQVADTASVSGALPAFAFHAPGAPQFTAANIAFVPHASLKTGED